MHARHDRRLRTPGSRGLEQGPATDYKLSTILGPGDDVDRRVARSGVTTVVLTPRSASKSGAPVAAYKPAANDPGRQVLADPAALRLSWTAQNLLESGQDVRELLAKAAAYRAKWIEYEAALASWTPPPPAPPKEEKKDDDEGDEDEDKEEEGADEKKDGDKKKKRKKKGEEELEPDPITGVWEAEVSLADDPAKLRMRLLFQDPGASGPVEGNLRCDHLSETLVELSGYWDREAKTLKAGGLGSRGRVAAEAKIEDGKLAGSAKVGDRTVEFACERTSKEYVVAKRAELRKVQEEKVREPKGKPKEPKLDEKLELLRRAMDGEGAVVVEVNREDELLECVEAFESAGIRPVLYGASDAHHVAARLASRVAGVLLSPVAVRYDSARATRTKRSIRPTLRASRRTADAPARPI